MSSSSPRRRSAQQRAHPALPGGAGRGAARAGRADRRRAARAARAAELVEGLGALDLALRRGPPRRAARRQRARGSRPAAISICARPGIRCWSPSAGGPRRARRGGPDGPPRAGRSAGARPDRPERGRQDGRARDGRPPRAHGARRLPHSGRAREPRAAHGPGAGPDRRRAEPRPGPLDVLLVRPPGPGDPRRRRRPSSLVLLDELGAGTDPAEGAALGAALLEALLDRGARVVATTHLEPLKVFAQVEPRLQNATVAFDAGRARARRSAWSTGIPGRATP